MAGDTGQLEQELRQLREAFASFTEAMLKFIGDQPDVSARFQAGKFESGHGMNQVKFPKTFPSTPIVVATMDFHQNGNPTPVHVHTVDINGFIAVPGQGQYVNWIAMAP